MLGKVKGTFDLSKPRSVTQSELRNTQMLLVEIKERTAKASLHKLRNDHQQRDWTFCPKLLGSTNLQM